VLKDRKLTYYKSETALAEPKGIINFDIVLADI
jgi:hypothetical protein